MKRISYIILLVFLVFALNFNEPVTARTFYTSFDKNNFSNNSLILKVNDDFSEEKFKKNYNVETIKINNDYYTIKFTEEVSEVVNKIKYDQTINYIEADYVFDVKTLQASEPRYSDLWQFNNSTYGVNPDSAWSFLYGSSDIVVGVLDTGIDTNHVDLNDNIWINPGEIQNGADSDGNGLIDDYRGWDFVANNNNVMDVRGHGTYVSGAIAAELNGIGVMGIAPRVKVMPLKVSDEAGSIYLSSVMTAITYGSSKGVRIFNMSFGSYSYIKSFDDLIKDTDALFIAAAGNGGVDEVGDNNDVYPVYPASYERENLIAVAAIDKFGALSAYSNYGVNTVHIGAPGTIVLTTGLSNSYVYTSGTSLATPYVAGAAAIIASYDKNFKVLEVKEALLNSSKKIPSLNNKVTTGGTLDLSAALTYYKSIIRFDGGLGTLEDPYLISNADQLNEIRNNLTANFKLTANIDLTTQTTNGGKFYNNGLGWQPIGTLATPFEGNIDGNNKTISGLTINRPNEDYVGLIGKHHTALVDGEIVKNLEINGTITGRDYVGFLTGYSNAVINSSRTTGKINGRNNIGGIAGNIYKIIKSTNEAEVRGNNKVGGIAGESSEIINSSNLGFVSGIDLVGGITGVNLLNIEKTFSAGIILANTNKSYIAGRADGLESDNYYIKSIFEGEPFGSEIINFEQSEYINFDFTNTWNFDGRIPYLKARTYIKLNDFTINNFTASVTEEKKITITSTPQVNRINFLYQIENTDIATITSEGLIKPKKIGTTKIKVKSVELGIEKELTITINDNMLGDLNGDKLVTTTDLIILRKYLAGLGTIDSKYTTSADINKDTNTTTTDLVKLRRYLAGLEGL